MTRRHTGFVFCEGELPAEHLLYVFQPLKDGKYQVKVTESDKIK